MHKLVAVLAVGLGLCLGCRASAQQNVINYPAIVPVSASTVTSQPAKAVAASGAGCCKSCNPSRDAKAGCCETCAPAPAKPCCCLDKLKNWCCYRALPNCCSCCYGSNCNPHVWAFFPPDRGCCGCGYGGGCATGGCASGGCAGGACPAGGCGQSH